MVDPSPCSSERVYHCMDKGLSFSLSSKRFIIVRIRVDPCPFSFEVYIILDSILIISQYALRMRAINSF
jgi:hypothetical protein